MPTQLRSAQRAKQALDLREAGYSFRRIAVEMGIGKSQAHALVTTQYRQIRESIPEAAEDAFQADLDRLDRDLSITSSIIANAQAELARARAIADSGGRQPLDLIESAEKRILAALRQRQQIYSRRAKMFGYDAQDNAESLGRGVGTGIMEEVRSMTDEELQRELLAYACGTADKFQAALKLLNGASAN